MAVVTISQTWSDGSVILVQVGDNAKPAYPDELAQLGHEARRMWRFVMAEELPDDD